MRRTLTRPSIAFSSVASLTSALRRGFVLGKPNNYLYSPFQLGHPSGAFTDEETAMASTSSTLAPQDESGIVSALNGIVTKTDVIAEAIRTGNHIDVILVRGGSDTGCLAAVNNRSAGGEPRNADCGAPTLQQMISQVGGAQPGIPQVKLPEFTSVPANSAKWARRGGWLVVAINTKYLIAGDAGEKGWICLKNAPLVSANYIPHPNPVTAPGGKTLPNAD